MKVHYDWLQDFIKEPLPSAKDVARELTMRAFEVEGIEKTGRKYPGVVVGTVLCIEKHPNADRVRMVFVDLGTDDEHQIICGAWNFEEGAAVAVATVGTLLPNGMEIKAAEIRGVESRGMICSKAELALEEKSDGIWVLETDALPGTLLDEIVDDGGVETVLDVDVLPNRAHDCLSHRGIAREIAALFNLTFQNHESDLPESAGEKTLSVEIQDAERCRRYIGAHLSGLVVKESPEWLQARLRAIGLRPKNTIVDATNYIMFALGQPLHAFDANKLQKKDGAYSIAVRAAQKGESIAALDDETYELTEEATVIADGAADSKAIAVGGVIGGADSAVRESTTEVILEAANFDPVLTRKTSQALKLATDSSKRFENEISPDLAPMAMNAVIVLLKDIAGNEDTRVHSIADVYPSPYELRAVSVSLASVNGLLGTTITETDLTDALARISFQVEKQGDVFLVTPPSDRLDIQSVPDVIEEIGRIYGFDTLPAELPPAREGITSINTRFYWFNSIRDVLVQNGFSEVMTYALVNTGELEIENPLASDKAFVRSDLASGVSQALEQNKRYTDLLGISDVNLFEIGNVYREGEERTLLCLASTDPKMLTKAQTALQEKFQEKFGAGLSFDADQQVVEIELGSAPGELKESDSYSGLADLAGDIRYRPASVYPYVLRDVALWVPKSVGVEEAEKVLLEQTGDLLVNHYLFDEYEPKEGENKSYAFRLVFQSFEKTLSDEEVNVIMGSVYKALDAKEGWETR
ncbi:MAG: phenylalanine--tRNA ligase subunit beta [Candidatus Paceibacterota bacterium]